MPPPISDDEASEASVESAVSVKEEKPTKSKGGRPPKAAVAKKEEPVVDKAEEEEEEEEEEDEDDDEEEGAPDEYVVEKILKHLVDEASGELRFQVKWEGYEKKSDLTWEPEDNLIESADEILKSYLDTVGGREQILADFAEKKEQNQEKKGKKRARASTDAETNGSGKRGRKGKNGAHPGESTPPASASAGEFKPPTGNWEEQIVAIDACEGGEGAVVVYLTWKGGHKTQHPLSQVYKRCPQRMLKFYESHLVFKKNDEA